MKQLRCVLLCFLFAGQLHAQDLEGAGEKAAYTLRIDTLPLARSLAYWKDFEKADVLLTQYNKDHNDVHALRLHAQVLYWMKAFGRSTHVYENALRVFPQSSSLYLDYARVLFQSNKLPETRRMLKVYQQYDPSNVEAEVMLAYINLWNGKTATARKNAKALLQKYPGNAEGKDILNQVSNYTVPYFKAGTDFLSDDQPLTAHGHHIEAGVYKSWLFAPTVSASVYQFRAENKPYHSSLVQASNTFQPLLKSKIKLKAGLFRQNGVVTAFTGGAEFSQRIAKSFQFQAAFDRRPYQYAISSIKHPVLEDMTSVSFNYNRKDKWLGKAAYELFQYKDANKIHTAYLWLLAPVISRPRFAVSAGYAFRYADAEKSNFVSKQPLAELIATPPYDGVTGMYSPYFTPENQKIHSALASVKIVPIKKLEFTTRMNIGVNATADNPYLWLDKRGTEFFVDRAHMNMKFRPVNWTSELRLIASKKCTIGANYSYDQLLYYKSHRGSLDVKYLFIR